MVAKEQPIPPDAITDENAVEFLRAFIVNGCLSISFQRAFDDPGAWGIALTDIARHAARTYAQEHICTEEEALERIYEAFDAEFSYPTDLGTTGDYKDKGH